MSKRFLGFMAAVLCLIGVTAAWGQTYIYSVPINPWDKEYTGAVRGISEGGNWAVGAGGLVLRKSGTTWNTVDLGLAEYDLNAVRFVGSYGWIVGEKKAAPNKYEGVLRRTTNGGTSWLIVSMPALPAGTAFKDISFASNGTGFIACGNGRVLKSTDRGANWTENIPFPLSGGDSYRWYQSVYTPDGVKVRLTADNVGTVDSTLGGGVWSSRVVKTLPDGYYTWPANTNIPNLALAPGRMGVNNWNQYIVPLNHGYVEKFGALSQPGPKSIWFPAADSVYVAGSDGELLNTWYFGNTADLCGITHLDG
ncbi:hypothetical protein HY768_10130, partial [candidate division TA06 bacterium]|nr:hypothetical protein [candidate division TA06 bacterium]